VKELLYKVGSPPCSIIQDLQRWAEDIHSGILRAYQMAERIELCETAKKCMNIDDLRLRWNTLHNFRVTRLWTACTRLIRKHLNPNKFH
jgi:hypothetical protein